MRRPSLFVSALLLLGIMDVGLAAEPPAPKLPFDVAVASYQSVEHDEVYDAALEAVHQATVSAQTSGRIVEVNFDVDDFVKKDSVLVRFRDKEQRAALEAAQARYQEAKSNFTRIQDLRGRKLVSQADFDKAQAGLKGARAALDQAQEQLEHTVVRAPYSGIVVKRHIEPGEMANPGQPLMTGLSLEQLRATASVPETYIDQIRAHGQAHVYLPGAVEVQGSRVTVSPYADPDTHTFRVRVDLPEGRYGVYPGMFAKVAFVVGEERQLLVPAQAVVNRSEVTAVYVVNPDNSVTFRQIRVGNTRKGETEVLAGLSDGEKVALDPIRAGVYLKQARSGGSHE